jgi:uncharacterized membrane protein
MLSSHLSPSGDLPHWAVWLALALGTASLAMLVVEMRTERRGTWWIVVTGALAVSALLAAVLRPARVSARETVVGSRVLVLADVSRSMALSGDSQRPRREARDRAVARVQANAQSARAVVFGFGDGAPVALSTSSPQAPDESTRAPRSDLGAALRALAASPEERPAAVVVVSDGRLDDPPEDAALSSLQALGDVLHVPIHAVATTRTVPPDASVRRVSAAGAAIAHVPLPLRIEVGCAGGLACDELEVAARELRDDGPPILLASGTARLTDGKAEIDLTITLERAGSHIVEVAIQPPAGDTIPANDHRLVTFAVARERVRVLHVAGRPTNDVRALRDWLKSDASVDVVAFFILRTQTDDVRAPQSELALIPFPVDELFREDLPTFDAVVLQDFDAQPYGLEQYLPNIERYVRGGGGLVMVGGQNSFVAGGYARTALAQVLPVDLDGSPNADGADTSGFVPDWTEEGRAAPLLAPLRKIVGDDLPRMPGANILGDVRPNGIALLTHPTRRTATGKRMPVIAIGEEGDGRSIALGVDGTWNLQFSELGARTGGRGYGALWDGLLGWLMRDPRFETAQLEVMGGCVAGVPASVRARLLPTAPSELVTLEVAKLDGRGTAFRGNAKRAPASASVDFDVPGLTEGAYTARLSMAGAPAARLDFACERGGDEWADSRPDAPRLEALAQATGGTFVFADDVASLRLPKPTVVSVERHVMPMAPPWAWSSVAAALLGIHWIARRRGGLS